MMNEYFCNIWNSLKEDIPYEKNPLIEMHVILVLALKLPLKSLGKRLCVLAFPSKCLSDLK